MLIDNIICNIYIYNIFNFKQLQFVKIVLPAATCLQKITRHTIMSAVDFEQAMFCLCYSDSRCSKRYQEIQRWHQVCDYHTR